MTQVNLSTKHSWTQRTDLVVAKGEEGIGEGWIGSLGLADANCYIENG